MEYFDSHCHLDPMRFGAELPAVLERAREAGVVGMAVIGTRAADSEAAAALAAREPGLVAAAGIHPNDVQEIVAGEWDRIEQLVGSGRVAAVGETGLDWYRDHAAPELQRDFFDRHIRLAQAHSLPLVVHTRDSLSDVLEMLSEAVRRGPVAAILHAFTGSVAEAAEAVALGCHLGFAGMVTFRSSAALREVAATVPLDRLLIETDSPFLSPEQMVHEAEARDYPFPYLYDESQAVAHAYHAACTPDFFLFDAGRKLAYRGQLDASRPGNGIPVTGEDLRAALNLLLAGQPLPAEQRPSLGCNIKWKPGNEPAYFST